MSSKKIKKIALVTSGPLTYTRAPAAAAFMAGICEKVSVDYEIIDINIEFRLQHGAQAWEHASEAINRINSYNKLFSAPDSSLSALNEFFEQVASTIKHQRFDAVAVSLLSYYQHLWSFLFLQKIKALCPNVTIILGGPGVGISANFEAENKISFGRHMLNNHLADCFVLGEGDILFEKFLVGEAQSLPGFNTSDNAIDTWQPQIDDLDQTALPSYKKVKFDHYYTEPDKREVTLTASRGCVRRCTFCDIGSIWKKFRFRSGQRVADEIYKAYTEMGITNFWFNDSLLNGSYKQFFEFMECLQKKQSHDVGFKNIKYGGQLILRNQTHHSEKMYEMLGETGGNFFQVGIESGSQSVRDHMGKKFTNDDIDYHYAMCEKFKLQNWIFMTVGYPTETEKDFQDTLDFYTKMQKYLLNDTIIGTSIPGPVVILENTPLADMMSELDLSWVHNENTPGAWISNTPGGLDLHQRFLRYTRLVRHILNLGYRMHAELSQFLESQQIFFENLTAQPQSSSKRVIPIEKILS